MTMSQGETYTGGLVIIGITMVIALSFIQLMVWYK